MPYILWFAVSAILIAVAEKQKKHTVAMVLSAVALLIPCLVAGLRDEHVGRDVSYYVQPMVDLAKSSAGFPEFLQGWWKSSMGYAYVADYEYGFSFVVYLFSKLTGSLQVVLFVIEALVLVPVYIALWRNRKSSPVWLGMVVFFFLFYNGSLNLMRQTIAMALLVLAFQMLLEKKPVLTALISAAALLFHYSALLAVFAYLVYGLLCLLKPVRWNITLRGKPAAIYGQTLAAILIPCVCFVCLFFAQPIAAFVAKLGFDRFTHYLNGQNFSLMPQELLLRLPLVALFVWRWKQFRENCPQAAFYLVMVLTDLVLSQLTSINPYTYRIPLYFVLYAIYGIPALCTSLKTPTQKNLTAALAIFWLVSYWGYLHAELYLHHTFPYYTIH